MIINTTDADFKKDTTEGLVLVDFWATSCKPCINLGLTLDKLNEDEPSVKIVKLNVEEYSDTASELGLMSVPNLLLYRDGIEVGRAKGGVSLDALKAWIKANS